jgi:hypothetical protein
VCNCIKESYSCWRDCIKEDITIFDMAREVLKKQRNPKIELDFRILRHLQNYNYDSICQIKKDKEGVFHSLVGKVVIAHDQSAFNDLISAVGVRVLGNETKSEEFNEMFVKYLTKSAGLDPIFNERALTTILLKMGYTFEQNCLSRFMNKYKKEDIHEFHLESDPNPRITHMMWIFLAVCFVSVIGASLIQTALAVF